MAVFVSPVLTVEHLEKRRDSSPQASALAFSKQIPNMLVLVVSLPEAVLWGGEWPPASGALCTVLSVSGGEEHLALSVAKIQRLISFKALLLKQIDGEIALSV